MTHQVRYLTAAEAAPILRMGIANVVLLCRSGKLRAYKPGRSWLITEADLRAYIESHSNVPPEAVSA